MRPGLCRAADSPLLFAQGETYTAVAFHLGMDWRGGWLHASKKGGGPLTTKQKAYFAKARDKPQLRRMAHGPIRFSDATQRGGQPGRTGSSVAPERKPPQQRRLEEFENTAGIVKKLDSIKPRIHRERVGRTGPDSASRCNSNLRGQKTQNDGHHAHLTQRKHGHLTRGQSNKEDSSRDVHPAAGTRSQAEDARYQVAAIELETLRQGLLQRTNWLKLTKLAPLEVQFLEDNGSSGVARRRKLAATESRRRGTVVIQGQQMKKRNTAVPPLQDGYQGYERYSSEPNADGIILEDINSQESTLPPETHECYQAEQQFISEQPFEASVDPSSLQNSQTGKALSLSDASWLEFVSRVDSETPNKLVSAPSDEALSPPWVVEGVGDWRTEHPYAQSRLDVSVDMSGNPFLDGNDNRSLEVECTCSPGYEKRFSVIMNRPTPASFTSSRSNNASVLAQASSVSEGSPDEFASPVPTSSKASIPSRVTFQQPMRFTGIGRGSSLAIDPSDSPWVRALKADSQHGELDTLCRSQLVSCSDDVGDPIES
jgi:hypothetical protein